MASGEGDDLQSALKINALCHRMAQIGIDRLAERVKLIPLLKSIGKFTVSARSPTIHPTKDRDDLRRKREAETPPEFLRMVLTYSPTKGLFKWKRLPKKGRAAAGWFAGCALKSGYCLITVLGFQFRAHRVAWAISHGEWPAGDLDHKNGDRGDNRLENLRLATAAENARNSRAHGEIPLKGVSRRSVGGKFQAQITVDRKRIHLGTFATAEEAHAAYKAACKSLHGKFARTA
jgi:hypothetical protein